jgi:hypothetical protein
VKPGPVCSAPDFGAGIQVPVERFIRRGRTDARHRNTQILQHWARRRVSRERWQGRRQVPRSEPPAADDDRGKNWTASRYPAGVLPVRRQADHHRRVLGRPIAPGMGAQSMGKSFGTCRARHGIFRAPRRASCAPRSANSCGLRSSPRRRSLASTNPGPIASSHCSSCSRTRDDRTMARRRGPIAGSW